MNYNDIIRSILFQKTYMRMTNGTEPNLIIVGTDIKECLVSNLFNKFSVEAVQNSDSLSICGMSIVEDTKQPDRLCMCYSEQVPIYKYTEDWLC